MSMDLQAKQAQNIKQIQRLIMSPQMQQAINLLQVPVQELSLIIDAELQQNPVLESDLDNPEHDPDNEHLEADVEENEGSPEIAPEKELVFDENDFAIIKKLDEDFSDYLSDTSTEHQPYTKEDEKLHAFLENSLQTSETLFEHLMNQAKESFDSQKKLAMAEAIIGNLDASGFLPTSLQEIAGLYHFPLHELAQTLKDIQQFDPNGVGAKSLQESLLLQLANKGKQTSLAYTILSDHYEDLLYNRIPAIQKKLRVSTEAINAAIDQEIAKLDLHPGASYSRSQAIPIVPDAEIILEGDILTVVINNDHLPPLRVNRKYMRMLYDENLNRETKEFIKNKIMSAKWLLRNIFQRNDTIERIAMSLAKRQQSFFCEPNGNLIPLTMKTIAEELSLHESTIARAVANKYINTPRGLFPLKFFFTSALLDEKGDDISSKTVKTILKELIDKENKARPLSDEALSKEIKDQGIPCARRTIAKYRKELNLGTAQQRRKF
jgi:RNA polymerase sigma-54 factor